MEMAMKTIDPKSVLPPANGRARLRRLADFLDTLADRDLTFCHWYGMDTGCAVGLAIVRDPWFRAEGLRLSEAEHFGDCGPVYGELADWKAICAFFDLHAREAAALLTADGYGQRLRPGPGEIAGKIRGFLRSGRLGGRATSGPSEIAATVVA